MKTNAAVEAWISRSLRFVRGALGMGLAGAAGLGGIIGVFKWLFGENGLRDAMVEAIGQGWPLLGFLLGSTVAGVRALYEVTDSSAYRFGVGMALGAAFLLVWTVLAVGGIGAGGPPDLMFAGVLGVGILGAIIARFQPQGMARALWVTAFAQTVVAVIAIAAGWHRLPGSSVLEIVGYCGFFAALFAGAGGLFQKAAQEQSPTGGKAAG